MYFSINSFIDICIKVLFLEFFGIFFIDIHNIVVTADTFWVIYLAVAVFHCPGYFYDLFDIFGSSF